MLENNLELQVEILKRYEQLESAGAFSEVQYLNQQNVVAEIQGRLMQSKADRLRQIALLDQQTAQLKSELADLNGKLVGVSFAALDKKKWLDEMGQIPTDMGYAIKSNMIKKVFEHKESVPVKSAKFNKAKLYEKMLPSIALVVVLLDEN